MRRPRYQEGSCHCRIRGVTKCLSAQSVQLHYRKPLRSMISQTGSSQGLPIASSTAPELGDIMGKAPLQLDDMWLRTGIPRLDMSRRLCSSEPRPRFSIPVWRGRRLLSGRHISGRDRHQVARLCISMYAMRSMLTATNNNLRTRFSTERPLCASLAVAGACPSTNNAFQSLVHIHLYNLIYPLYSKPSTSVGFPRPAAFFNSFKVHGVMLIARTYDFMLYFVSLSCAVSVLQLRYRVHFAVVYGQPPD